MLSNMMFQAAGAGAAGAAGGSTATALIMNLLPMVGIIAIFYFLLIRPQNKRQKAHREMLAALKKGDTVITSGGIIGRIFKLSDDEVVLDTLEGGKLRIMRPMIMDLKAKGEPAPANDAKES
jgi:preprotein translocase subunit YajC